MAALTGTNLRHAKHHNLQIVLETIRLYGPLSRADTARRTQLTPQTVSNLARQLLQHGLIVEADRRNHGRGAPSISLEVNADAAYAVGLDFDVDHLTAVLVNLSGEVVQRIHHDLAEPTPEEAVTLLAETTQALVRQEGLPTDHVWGVGLGVPGPMVPAAPNQHDTYVVSPKALPGWRDVPLAEHLHERIGLPVFIENNATAAAVGEHWYGAGRLVSTFFYVYLGSGLGGGLVVQGHPFEGLTGNAGEVGYLPPSPTSHAEGEQPHLGSLFNLRELYQRLDAEGAHAASLADLVTLLHDESPALTTWLDEAAEQLSFVLLAVEYLLDPQATFVGGRWPDALMGALLDRARVLVPRRRVANKPFVPELLLATAGTDAAALGVATLPLYSTFAPQSRLSLKQANNGDPVPNLPV